MFDYTNGYLWWMSEFGKEDKKESIFMTGTGGNKVAVFADLELVVVLTSDIFFTFLEGGKQTVLTNVGQYMNFSYR